MDALELRAAVGFGSSQMAIYERPLAACCRAAELFQGLILV